MNWWWLILGLAMVIVALVDALWTTLWVDGGGGPLVGTATRLVWRGVHRLVPEGRHRMRSLTGPLTLAVVLLFWVLLLWTGWVAVFSAERDSLVVAPSGPPGDLSDRIYFVGYALFTMGNGDFSPQGTLWQLMTAACTASGMMLVTLAITYLLSIVSAVVEKRRLAAAIFAYGRTAEQWALCHWDNGRLVHLALHLDSLASQLDRVTEQHLAYPVLHYYHAADPGKALPPALAVFDDALTLLESGLAPDGRPPRAVLAPARASVSGYLDTLAAAFISPADQPPPAPSLEPLRAAGVPAVGDAELAAALGEAEQRRRRLLGAARGDGWDWPPV